MAAGQCEHGHRLLAWRNLRLARCVLAFPLVVLFQALFLWRPAMRLHEGSPGQFFSAVRQQLRDEKPAEEVGSEDDDLAKSTLSALPSFLRGSRGPKKRPQEVPPPPMAQAPESYLAKTQETWQTQSALTATGTFADARAGFGRGIER